MLTNNWTTKTSVCSWIGVTCNHYRVTELDISDMGLVGTISPEIGNLSSLVSLNIMGNFFHGYVPPSIFNMSSLEIISATNNSLSGRLAGDMCSHGVGRVVKVIDLSYNELYGEIPSSLEQCSQLEMIALFMNKFSGRVPREIGNITGLTALFLSFNDLDGKCVYIYYLAFLLIDNTALYIILVD
ncbi:leucine-rich repeat receptor-like serine/threonine-protein kinase bam1 [Phtheirospermum japonicum]|uniref:Leucine-rich repeat receptor-like serine/threonine-protein kinase bam1 n=1 Tax=Phtheirospermum japonicum TaxID=374723 RepID=A0A830D9Z0_9LAMI|nr:leucine-rich repeat receptor-like serine/threonine-protein kinase bam1 [Phtheirospermum japonicum]